ncbi:carbohydrate ABC transporter permease [Galbitalea soli]|uniref:Carbohydrate ABC transporter permease n=1 Tax=Galbitalea soli TaxID=1268042 RepID=A0A7C9PMZ1_9MICO|nr:carbohydrate ABC transporter permease [Galbitalea soli]NEM91049.1 carbohydrate ABC transporter permease [Galbitalea soli]NYJ29737.1 alpha-glucoside transport system permease protein [Galbitalea soli]
MTQAAPTLAVRATAERSAATARTATKRRPNRRIVLNIILGLFAILWMIPVIGLLVTAFRSTTDAQTTGWWTAIGNVFGQHWTTTNFVTAFTNLDLGTNFFNSVAVTVPATVLPIMFAAFAAYGFTFLDFKGKEVYFAVIVGLLVVPTQVALIPVLQAYVAFTKATGIPIVGQFPAAWVYHSAFALPLAIFILRNYMSTLPVALIEAARVDGASHFQIFWRLVVPMSMPALASFAIFQFLWVWNDYLTAYIFLGDANPVLTQALYGLLGQYAQGWNLVAAGSFITIVVPLIVFFGMQRYFVRGLTAGSVK